MGNGKVMTASEWKTEKKRTTYRKEKRRPLRSRRKKRKRLKSLAKECLGIQEERGGKKGQVARRGSGFENAEENKEKLGGQNLRDERKGEGKLWLGRKINEVEIQKKKDRLSIGKRRQRRQRRKSSDVNLRKSKKCVMA